MDLIAWFEVLQLAYYKLRKHIFLQRRVDRLEKQNEYLKKALHQQRIKSNQILLKNNELSNELDKMDEELERQLNEAIEKGLIAIHIVDIPNLATTVSEKSYLEGVVSTFCENFPSHTPHDIDKIY